MNYTTDDAYADGFRDGERNMAGDIAKLRAALTKDIQLIEQLCATCNALMPRKVRAEDFTENARNALSSVSP